MREGGGKAAMSKICPMDLKFYKSVMMSEAIPCCWQVIGLDEGVMAQSARDPHWGSGTLTGRPGTLTGGPETLIVGPGILTGEPGTLNGGSGTLNGSLGTLIWEPGTLSKEPEPSLES